jgi:hypothetical protein
MAHRTGSGITSVATAGLEVTHMHYERELSPIQLRDHALEFFNPA